MPKTVGILGGMGPDATAAFFQKIIDLTPASRDQEHIPVVLISEPRIPDRCSYLMGFSGESPEPYLVELAQRLEKAGADLIAMPCNTAHKFWPQIARGVAVPVLHIVDETLRVVRCRYPGARSLGLLATTATVSCGLYQEAADEDFTWILPGGKSQAVVQGAIEAVKGHQDLAPHRKGFQRVVEEIASEGAEVVIYGCTELGLFGVHVPDLAVVDSLEALAEAAVEQALLGEIGTSAGFGGFSAQSH
ncbi:MAG TPA: amino acid racemase [Acidobacteriota bacterium]|jgi:aspartate racemase|nr:amino acid racemase [Acidobacteriota bacterium]HRR56533.1 amino acid racemase [Acidobacteriota bacterium]HRV09574.1 amino acid racemase [Acidobacteriota bacterium]